MPGAHILVSSAQSTTNFQRYLSDVQLAKRYGVSRATIWRWAANGILPQPEKISDGCTRWRLDVIDRRDAERQAQGGA